METMMRDANPGLARRFQIDNAFIFEDYSSEDLFHIMSAKAKEDGWEASFETLRAGVAVLEKEKMKPNFGNGGAINNLLSKATTNYELRMKQDGRSALERAQCRRLLPEDMDPACAGEAAHDKQRKIDALFSDLIGGKSVLEQVAEIRNTIKLAEKLGRDPRDDVTLNYVFAGPPGTGKTTVARRMGQLFQLFDLLPSSDVVQTTPADLSTGYVGQARKQARKVFESALGKVLFIDEAYGLNPRVGGQFMAEAVDEMVAMLTDERFKGKMMLILAGYEGDMEEMLKTNVGLKSRIPGKITFDPFDATATVELLRVALCKKGLTIGPDVASSELNDMAQQLVESPNFANGRDIHTWADEVYRKVASAPATAASSSSPPNVATIEYIRSALHAFLKKKSAPSGPAQSKLPPSAPPQLAPAEPPHVSAPPAVTLAEPSIEKVEAKEPQGHQVEESFEMVDPPDDDSIYTLLEEAASALSYSIEATRDMCATEHFPDDILKYIKEKTNKGSAEAMRGALRTQCPALLIKMDTLIRVKAEEEARTKSEEEAMQAAEARRKRREQIIRCAACGSPFCSFMPRVVGYRDVDE